MSDIRVRIQSAAPILSCILHLPSSDDDFRQISRTSDNNFSHMPDGLYGVSISSTAQPPGTPIIVSVASTNNEITQTCAIAANGTVATMIDFFISGGTVV